MEQVTSHPFVSNRNGEECLECGQPPEAEPHQTKEIDPKVAEELLQKAIAQAQQAQAQPGPEREWSGDTPFYLVYVEDGAKTHVEIDVDTPGWIAVNKERMRSPSTWYLADKRNNRPLFVVVLQADDQFYFAKRHVGDLMRGKEIVAIGIGKKKADGVPVNLWILPNGLVCGGDDVEILGARLVATVP